MSDEHRTKEPPPPPRTGADEEAIRALEEEFIELSREIEEITSLPEVESGTALARVIKLRESWRQKDAERGPMPEWRERIETIFRELIERMLAQTPDSTEGRSTVSLDLASDVLQKHGKPLVDSLLAAAAHALAIQKADRPAEANPTAQAPTPGASQPEAPKAETLPPRTPKPKAPQPVAPKKEVLRKPPSATPGPAGRQRSLAEELQLKKALKKGYITREQIIKHKADVRAARPPVPKTVQRSAGSRPPDSGDPKKPLADQQPGTRVVTTELPGFHYSTTPGSISFSETFSKSFTWKSGPESVQQDPHPSPKDQSGASPVPAGSVPDTDVGQRSEPESVEANGRPAAQSEKERTTDGTRPVAHLDLGEFLRFLVPKMTPEKKD